MTANETLTLLACQIGIPPTTTVAERDAHLETSVAKIEKQLVSNDAVDLVVLPELSSMDYSREAFSNLNTLAEPLDGA
ncbi:MAG: hypothetical protein K5905_30080, partial [Roseibium sp.]|nr:hypothetical protein [Roseibium sp.]